MNQDQFFPSLIGQLKQEQANLCELKSKFENQDSDKQMIDDCFRLIQEIYQFLDEVQIYILVKGTVSAGKSTFINSLLGLELLPSKNQECTSQPLYIKYGDQLKINEDLLENVSDGTNLINNLMKLQTERIDIEAFSVFHRQLPGNLRDRVVIVDYPGFITGQTNLNNLLEIPECIRSDDQVIQLILSDYQAFAEQKNKIKQSIEQTQKKKKTQKILQYIPKENPKQFWFIINKIDQRKKEDDPLKTIIQEIVETAGKEAEIFLISSLKGLQYRIMAFQDKKIQELLVQNYFEDHQDDFDDFKDCLLDCSKKFTRLPMVESATQQYQKLINKLNEEVQNKIKILFDEKLTILKSNYYFLQILSNNILIIIQQPSKEDQILHQKNWSLLENYKTKIDKETMNISKEIESLILSQQKQFEVFQQVKSKQKKSTSQILSEICFEISQRLDKYHNILSEEGESLKINIFTNLSQLQIPIVEKQALVYAVENLFKMYFEVQSVEIAKKTKNVFEQCYKDTLGVLVITQPVTELGLLGGGIGALGYFLGVTYEATAIASNSARMLAWCSAGVVGGAVVGALSTCALIFQTGKFGHQLYKNNIAHKNLETLLNQLKNQLNPMSDEFISIVKNVQTCLKCLSHISN